MAIDSRRSTSRKKHGSRTYLVRSYDQALVPDGSAGYYFTSEEAGDVKRELEERYQQYLFSIQVFKLPTSRTYSGSPKEVDGTQTRNRIREGRRTAASCEVSI